MEEIAAYVSTGEPLDKADHTVFKGWGLYWLKESKVAIIMSLVSLYFAHICC